MSDFPQKIVCLMYRIFLGISKSLLQQISLYYYNIICKLFLDIESFVLFALNAPNAIMSEL